MRKVVRKEVAYREATTSKKTYHFVDLLVEPLLDVGSDGHVVEQHGRGISSCIYASCNEFYMTVEPGLLHANLHFAQQ